MYFLLWNKNQNFQQIFQSIRKRFYGPSSSRWPLEESAKSAKSGKTGHLDKEFVWDSLPKEKELWPQVTEGPQTAMLIDNRLSASYSALIITRDNSYFTDDNTESQEVTWLIKSPATCKNDERGDDGGEESSHHSLTPFIQHVIFVQLRASGVRKSASESQVQPVKKISTC